MQNNTSYENDTLQFISDFQFDHDVELYGRESIRTEIVEAPQTWNGHSVGYHTAQIQIRTFVADGFIWKHPHGATIEGMFAEPVKALEQILDCNGDELERDTFRAELRKAIVAKCGKVNFADSLLDL